ncbi:MAG TPA: thiamine pyrophosphate-dependent enzyme [Streptosporangiaceae bacterium]|nr:thiamine pyrophosphate-dependent enzyme [Streptosporangiaceae bacterium]
MKVYQAIARLLTAAGVTTVFGVMGDGNMHWLAEYASLPGTRWCPAWHEAGAVGMADGYAVAARAAELTAGETTTVGVATVTMGPGVAQALGALTAAVRTRSPVVVITAEPAHVTPPNSQDIDQRSWAATAGARYWLVTDPADAGSVLAEAMASARSGQPAVVAIAAELMEHEIDSLPAAADPDGRLPGPALPADGSTDEALTAAAELLASSNRPLVLLGRGAVAGCAIPAAVELGRRIGAGFLSTVPAKGCIAGFQDPFDLGLAGTMAHPAARELAASADVVLVVGAALDSHNTARGSFFDAAELIRIDCRPPAQLWQPGWPVTEITSGSAAAVAELGRQLPASIRPGLRTQATAALLASEPPRRAALAARETPDGLNPWAVIAAIDDAVPGDAHIITGVGHFWYFAAPYLSARPGRTFHFGYGFGLIGQGIPLAAGAAVASLAGGRRRPAVAIEGDGSFLMNLQELQSAVRFGADLLVLVLNNEAYGSEFHKLGIAGLDPAGGCFPDPVGISQVATALGAAARQARTPAELQAGLTAFSRSGGVRVLDIAIARSVMSEAYQLMHLSGEPAGTPRRHSEIGKEH